VPKTRSRQSPSEATPSRRQADLDEVLASAVQLACDILKSDSASIALADEKGVLAVHTQHGLSPRFVSRWRKNSNEGLTGIVFRTGQPYVSPDLLADRHYKGTALTKEGLRALLVVPLKVGGAVVGCLYVGQRTCRDFSSEEVQLASLFAGHVSMSIESATLLQKEREQRRLSETLLDVVSAPSVSLSLRKVLVKLCQSVLKLTIGERCSIFMFNEDTHTLEPVMSLGVEDPNLWDKFRASAGLNIPELKGIGEAIKAQEPIIEENAPNSTVVPRFWTETFGLKSLALYPLVHREKTIGMLEVDSFSKFVRFPAKEIETLAAIAKQAAIIIENARLFEQEQRQRQRAEALVEVLTATASTYGLKKVLIKLCQAVVNLSVGDRCSILLTGEDGRSLVPVMSLGVEDQDLWKRFRNPAPGENAAVAPEHRLLQTAIRTWENPIVLEDAATSGLLTRWWVETFNIKSLVHYPLRVKDQTIGIMTVDAFRHHVHFPQEEIDTLTAVAKQAAVVIEDARLYEQEQQQRQRAEALADVLTATASDLSLKKVLVKVCQAVVNLSVGERCSIFLMDGDRHRLAPVMSIGPEDDKLWQRFRNPPASVDRSPGTKRFFEAATRWQKPIVVEDAKSSPLVPGWWAKTFDTRSLVLYPLRVKDKTIGAMTVDTSRDNVSFPQEEVETLSAIAKQAAVAIGNARLYEQEQQQRQRAEALVNVLTVAASDLSFRDALAKICRSIVDFSVGERCSIFLFNEETHTMEPVMAVGPGDTVLYERFRASAGVPIPEFKGIGEAIKARGPIVEENAPASKRLPPAWVREFKVKSVVVYPLVHREKTVGLLVVNTFSDFTHFPEEEVETLSAVAKQSAIIIENARLHEQLREQAITDPLTGLYNHRHIHERLDEEFARASRNGQPLAVLMMDMDNFKFFNDTRGHLVGDEALRFAAGLFRKALRVSDIVGRYGGDEFLAILPETSREEAERTGQRIVELLTEHPFSLDDPGQQVPLEVSIGVACFPGDTAEKQELIALADEALYEAKRTGGSQVVPAHADSTAPAVSWGYGYGFGFLHSLLNALAHKDPYTKKHCEDNVRYIDRLADELQLPTEARESLRKAALLHDVGKIAIPDSTLMKPGPLDNGEWEVMRQHVQFGEAIVRGISQISDAIEPVATHHERYDGTGYPRGLKGEKIPFLGRILAVVDAYSAMTLDRPYRKALGHEEAKAELRKGSGSQFDPHVLEAFLAVIEAEERTKTAAA
jgi:diguanylate cyclase (GGDEF)-like protein